MNVFNQDQAAWLAQVTETALLPEMPIIDPHHHLWKSMNGDVYTVDEFQADTDSGHNIVASVYMECGAEYLSSGPDEEKSLGETAFVLEQAAMSREVGSRGTPIRGMVGHVDLRLGDALATVLDKHQAMAGDFFKGIRHAGASAEDGATLFIPGGAPRQLFSDPSFREGVRALGERGLIYESWHYHYQIPDFIDLARACPDTTFVLDHFGTPLGVPPYDEQRDAIFASWQRNMQMLSDCANVHLKLGGLAMPDNGYGWHLAERPPTSDEFVAAQADWYLYAIETFGPERCMFESNFPVDRLSIGYGVLYNGFKKIASGFTQAQQQAMFFGNANTLYTLGL